MSEAMSIDSNPKQINVNQNPPFVQNIVVSQKPQALTVETPSRDNSEKKFMETDEEKSETKSDLQMEVKGEMKPPKPPGMHTR